MSFKSLFVTWIFVGVLAGLLALLGVHVSVAGRIFAAGSVGLVAFYWLSYFILWFRQQAINRKMLSLLKQMDIEEVKVRKEMLKALTDTMAEKEWSVIQALEGSATDGEIVRPTEKLMSSLMTVFELILYPSEAFNRSIARARDLAPKFRSEKHYLSTKEMENLKELQKRQMKLLGRRSTSIGACQLMFCRDFLIADYRRRFTQVKTLMRCKYCLVSWWKEEHVPVVMYPPR